MNEQSIMWLVLTAIATIVALFKTVGEPILKLNTTITKIESKLENFDKLLKDDQSHNKEAHQRIHDRIDNVEEDINDLDNRVSILENK